MNKEEIAQWVIDNRYPKSENNKMSDSEMYYILIEKIEAAISVTHCCTELKDKEEMNLVEYAISEGYTYNNENHYFYKGGRMHLDSNVRDKYIKEVVMDIDITKHL